MIPFEQFKKLDFRVGEIKEAENIEKSRQLMKFKVDIGDEIKQIVGGFKNHYAPEDVIGKKVIVIANLEPTTLMGVKSEGMIMAACSSDEETIRMIIPDGEAETGWNVY